MKESTKKLRASWQQPKESDEAYEAFEYYLDLGPGRTLLRVAKYLEKSHQLIERWSVRWCWRDRLEGRVPDDIGKRGCKKRISRGPGTAGMESASCGGNRTNKRGGDQGPQPPGTVAVRLSPRGPIYFIFKHTLEDFLLGYPNGCVVPEGSDD